VSKKDLFIEKIKQIYPDNWEVVLKTLEKPRVKTFRDVLLVATHKPNNFSFAEGPLPNSFVCTNDFDLTSTEEFKNHQVYIQGLSSMLPGLVAKCDKGDEVLDLCAAPGSKSSQIANETKDGVMLTCVENNTARIHALKENLEQQNIHNFTLVKADAAQIQYNPVYFDKFDKIIADVPCSNEGNIRLYDERLVNTWNPKLAKKISMLQKRIISSGIKSLKKGGRLVYSTCTYSIEENEEVLDWALKHFKDVRLEEFKLNIPNILSGKVTYGKKNFDPSLKYAIRVLPTDLFDGFFVASLLKF
jgi:16S rRNA C967 or C1407 C5-methylase (RsmB/RsmF family)